MAGESFIGLVNAPSLRHPRLPSPRLSSTHAEYPGRNVNIVRRRCHLHVAHHLRRYSQLAVHADCYTANTSYGEHNGHETRTKREMEYDRGRG